MNSSVYKNYLIVPRGKSFQLFDIRGQAKMGFPSERQARDFIDAEIARKVKEFNVGKPAKIGLKNHSDIFSQFGKPTLQPKIIYAVFQYYDENSYLPLYSGGTFRQAKDYFLELAEIVKNEKKIPDARLVSYNRKTGKNLKVILKLSDLIPDKILTKTNPLTRVETKNVIAESRIHRRIKKPYYKGVAEGMKDIAEQYGKRNPPRVEVYRNIIEIVAQKGPGHKCDADCKRHNHIYRHEFNGSASIYGNPDGSLTIKSNR